MLANGARLGTPPAEIKKDADALALLSGALADRAVIAGARCAVAAADRPGGARAPASDHGGGGRRLRPAPRAGDIHAGFARCAPGAAEDAGRREHRHLVAGGDPGAGRRAPAGGGRGPVGAARSRPRRRRLRAGQAPRTPAGPGAPGPGRRTGRIDRGRSLAGHPPRAVAGGALCLRAPRCLAAGVRWKASSDRSPSWPGDDGLSAAARAPRRCAQRSGCARARPCAHCPRRASTSGDPWRSGSPPSCFSSWRDWARPTRGSATSRG